MYLTLRVYVKFHTDTHNIDGGENGTEREVHSLPHTRRAAGPADYGGAAGALEGCCGASGSIWPGEELCGFCFTKDSCFRWMEYAEISRVREITH